MLVPIVEAVGIQGPVAGEEVLGSVVASVYFVVSSVYACREVRIVSCDL